MCTIVYCVIITVMCKAIPKDIPPISMPRPSLNPVPPILRIPTHLTPLPIRHRSTISKRVRTQAQQRLVLVHLRRGDEVFVVVGEGVDTGAFGSVVVVEREGVVVVGKSVDSSAMR